MRVPGAVAKRLCPGLQIRLVRFDSGPRLQKVSAGIAQLVERNLAKVEVESSRLFSRSNTSPRYRKMSGTFWFLALDTRVCLQPGCRQNIGQEYRPKEKGPEGPFFVCAAKHCRAGSSRAKHMQVRVPIDSLDPVSVLPLRLPGFQGPSGSRPARRARSTCRTPHRPRAPCSGDACRWWRSCSAR